MKKIPTCWIIAGVNGAGKTTFALEYLPKIADCRQFINADLIAAGLSPLAPERELLTANILHKPPSQNALAALAALQSAVTKTLAKKEKLGHYAVIWKNGEVIETGFSINSSEMADGESQSPQEKERGIK